MCHTEFCQPFPRSQRGAVLIIGLIMLLLMTIVALSSVRGSNMQELMAGSMRNQQMSFQAAESGLRAGEAAAWGANILDPEIQPPTLAGYSLELPNGASASYWQTLSWDSTNSVDSLIALAGQTVTPRYAVEVLEMDSAGGNGGSLSEPEPPPIVLRITSRGVGLTANSITFLQSIIIKYQ
jgi:type IV pilus assembly protein PilX